MSAGHRFSHCRVEEDVWLELRSSALPVTLSELAPILFNADGETKAIDVNHFLDTFALHSRIDAVDENGVPFLPFVRDLNATEFEALKYGVLVSPQHHSIFVHHPFKNPLADFAQREGLKPVRDDEEETQQNNKSQQRPTDAAAEGVTTEDIERVVREAQKLAADAAQASMQKRAQIIQAEHHFFLMRVVRVAVPVKPKKSAILRRTILGPRAGEEEEPAPEVTAESEQMTMQLAVVPMFGLVFRNVGDESESGANYRLTAVQVTAHRYWEIHADLRELASRAPALDYYTRYSTSTHDALRLREEAWQKWCDITQDSVLLSPPRSRPATAETLPQAAAGVVSTLDGPRASQGRPATLVADNINRSAYVATVSGHTMNYLRVGHFQHENYPVALQPPADVLPYVRDFVPRRCTYTVDRMKQRVVILEQLVPAGSGGVRSLWPGICNELRLNERTECAIVLFKDTRHGAPRFEEGELLTYLPSDAEVNRLSVCRTHSEEQLRLWVLSALVAAHQKRLHQLLIRVDIPWMLGRCAEITTIASETATRTGQFIASTSTAVDNYDPVVGGEMPRPPAHGTARRRCVAIVIRTIEDFIRRSGVVWRVVLAPVGDGSGDELALVQEELQSAQNDTTAREYREAAETRGQATVLQQPPASPYKAVLSPSKPAAGGSPGTPSRPKTRHGLEGSSMRSGDYSSPAHRAEAAESPQKSSAQKAALVPSAPPTLKGLGARDVDTPRKRSAQMQRPVDTAVDNPIVTASIHGHALSDQALMALFRRLDVDKSGWLSAAELKRVFLKEEMKYDEYLRTPRGTIAPQKSQPPYLAPGNMLNPLDACGLPWDDAAVNKFVAKFCKQTPGRMSYPEFSIMMLELARR